MLDGQDDEVHIVAAMCETQISAARGLNGGRSQGASYAASALVQLREAAFAVNDRQIEEVGGLGFGVECRSHLEFVGEDARKGSGMLNEEIFVALANDVAQAEIQCRQENEMHRHHPKGDESCEARSQSCHTTLSILTRGSCATSLAHA